MDEEIDVSLTLWRYYAGGGIVGETETSIGEKYILYRHNTIMDNNLYVKFDTSGTRHIYNEQDGNLDVSSGKHKGYITSNRADHATIFNSRHDAYVKADEINTNDTKQNIQIGQIKDHCDVCYVITVNDRIHLKSNRRWCGKSRRDQVPKDNNLQVIHIFRPNQYDEFVKKFNDLRVDTINKLHEKLLYTTQLKPVDIK